MAVAHSIHFMHANYKITVNGITNLKGQQQTSALFNLIK